MRGVCPFTNPQDGTIDCERMKSIKIDAGHVIKLGLTTEHRATELWKDWKEDRRRL
jgi:hypothetical protein